MGTVSVVKQILRLPGDTLRILVEGKYRARITECIQMEPFFFGRVETVADLPYAKSAPKFEALIRRPRRSTITSWSSPAARPRTVWPRC